MALSSESRCVMAAAGNSSMECQQKGRRKAPAFSNAMG
jgi:hypothetical protein